jgi:hypothetical protein
MKKLIAVLILTISIPSISNAYINLPLPNPPPSRSIYDTYNAITQSGLNNQRQELENEMLEQRLEMMRQEQAQMQRYSRY